MSGRARRTAVLVLLAVFLAGAAAGWLLEEVADDLDWRMPAGARHEPPDRDDDPLDDDAEEDFLESLGLTRAQLDSVDRLLDAREDRLEAYWATRLPDLEGLIDSSRAAIRELLNPEQRAAYDRWARQQRDHTPD